MSTFIKTAVISTLLSASILPIAAFSWNATGHKVIANIAYQQLTPTAKSAVDKLVSKMHQQYPDESSFVDFAPWLDEIRSQKIDLYGHWHYVDTAISTDGSSLKNLTDTDNALTTGKNMEVVLKNDRANDYERARVMVFFEHIIGDIHQPLHTVSDITSQTPDGDRGGNDYTVYYNGQKTKLHSLWDSGVGVFSNDSSSSSVQSLANSIMQKYPASYFGQRAYDTSFDTMAKEGIDVAKQYVYSVSYNGTASSQYISTGQEVAKQQAALAGYRLAKVLNDSFK